ncbi:MAG: hypothetical protein ACJ8HU_01305 [Chthoniobacterales bacterium]
MSVTKCSVSLALLAIALLSGCASGPQTTMLAPARAPIATVETVRVYRNPPKRFQEIAIIEGRSVDELRAKAAAVGANGILPGGVVHKPGPYFGVGIGGGSYSYGHHGGVGIDTGAAVDIPTGSSFLSGTAIYVP